MSYTPGPWKAGPGDHAYIDDKSFSELAVRGGDDDLVLACVICECVPEHEDNASLIAAAPELYEACRELMGLAEREGWLHMAINMARAALAKAEGKQ